MFGQFDTHGEHNSVVETKMPSGWFEQDLDPMSGKTTPSDASPQDEAAYTSNLGKISSDLQRLVAIMEKYREEAANRAKPV